MLQMMEYQYSNCDWEIGVTLLCIQFTSTEEKLDDITSAVLNQLIGVCGDDCGISSDIIDLPSFDCDPDSTTTVIYLASLSGTSERQ